MENRICQAIPLQFIQQSKDSQPSIWYSILSIIKALMAPERELVTSRQYTLPMKRLAQENRLWPFHITQEISIFSCLKNRKIFIQAPGISILHSDVSQASFVKANLAGALFIDVDLQSVNFKDANLDNATFINVYHLSTSTILSAQSLKGARFLNVDFGTPSKKTPKGMRRMKSHFQKELERRGAVVVQKAYRKR